MEPNQTRGLIQLEPSTPARPAGAASKAPGPPAPPRRRPPAPAPQPGRVPPGATADALTEALVAPVRPAPETGWRRALFALTGGTINLGPSPAELRERDRAARVRIPVDGCRKIVVCSRKGGTGKTTTTGVLGATFASMRGDRVIAVDANPDAGTLAYRIAREHDRTITDLLDDWPASVAKYQDVRRFTSQATSRLEVLASNPDPRLTEALSVADYLKVLEGLGRLYNMILVDTGTDIRHAATQAVLDVADQVVVVVAPSLDGARGAAQTLDWLDSHGHAGLVSGAVAVLNGARRRTRVDLAEVRQHFSRRCRAVVGVPWDAQLQAGARTELSDLTPATRSAFTDVAAAVADGFAGPPTLESAP